MQLATHTLSAGWGALRRSEVTLCPQSLRPWQQAKGYSCWICFWLTTTSLTPIFGHFGSELG